MQRCIQAMAVLVAISWVTDRGSAGEQVVLELARKTPVVAEADVVIAGGASAAVAAVEAAQPGVKVFLLIPEPYRGSEHAGRNVSER